MLNEKEYFDILDSCDSFEDYVKKCHILIENEIIELFPTTDNQSLNFYLYEPLKTNVLNFGKCTRPLTCLLGCALFSKDVAKALRSACAIEMFQTAALIHDDIADRAKTRRSAPCLHLTQGENVALNAGDFALSLVDNIVLDDSSINEKTKIDILKQIYEMKARTIEGQALDLGWVRDKKYDLKIDDYVFMATNKTAYYTIAKPLVIGAIIANSKIDKIKKLEEFGLKIGLAFQIQDDILNVDITKKNKSKDFALDIKEGKRTLILIHALKELDNEDKKELLEIINKEIKDEESINSALSLLEKSCSIEYAKEFAKSLVDESKEILLSNLNESKARDILISMCNWCTNRIF